MISDYRTIYSGVTKNYLFSESEVKVNVLYIFVVVVVSYSSCWAVNSLKTGIESSKYFSSPQSLTGNCEHSRLSKLMIKLIL